jgi:hypothetical protein
MAVQCVYMFWHQAVMSADHNLTLRRTRRDARAVRQVTMIIEAVILCS